VLDALPGMLAGRDREIDPWVLEYPLGIVAFGDRGLGAEQGGVESDRTVEIFDPDMDV
jgi:hypothetical protein